MKKIVFLLIAALCLPLGLMAQSNDDDLYFVPSKDQKEDPAPAKKTLERREASTNIYTVPGNVVIQDRKGNTRDIDEYNRRYDASDNDFVMEDDTLYIKEKEQSDLDGEWLNGEFNGSQDDYEYAERIIRFRNPRFAVSISSPLYWDIVYGTNSWDWNIYSDGIYAYAFPTFSNPMWWDWRFNSWGWGGYYPYNSWGNYPGYWGGWYGGYGGYYGGWHGGHWGHHHHGWYPSWGHGGNYWSGQNTYYNSRRSASRTDGGNSYRRSTSRDGSLRSSDGSTSRRSSSTYDRSGSTSRRVVGTRSSSERPGTSTRPESSSSRRGSSSYTRPSSTRSSSSSYDSGSSRRSSSNNSGSSSGSSQRSSSSYNRGSSSSSSRSSSTESSRRSYNSGSSSSSSRSYSPSSSGSSRSSGSSYSSGGGGGSSRSSGGGGGSSRSSGGGSSRR